MADIHITRELLEAVAQGEIPVRVLEDMLQEHLDEGCPHCGRELAEFTLDREAARRRTSPGPDLDAVSAVLDRHLQAFRQAQDRARRDVAKLLARPRDERIATVERSRTRYRGPQVAWILLDESRAAVTSSPDDAEHLAELACLVILCSPAWVGCMGLLALATAHVANACRAGGKGPEADRHFESVRSVITHEGVTDTEILARIDQMEGSLRMEQGRFEEAEKLLSRAILLFSLVDETVERARTLIELGGLYRLRGDVTRAEELTRAGQQALSLDERHLKQIS